MFGKRNRGNPYYNPKLKGINRDDNIVIQTKKNRFKTIQRQSTRVDGSYDLPENTKIFNSFNGITDEDGYVIKSSFNKVEFAENLFLWLNPTSPSTNNTIVIDKSGNGLHGTFINSDTNEIIYDEELGKYVYDFDGVDDYIKLPTLLSHHFSNGYTFCGWIKFNNKSGIGSDRIFDFSSVLNDYHYGIFLTFYTGSTILHRHYDDLTARINYTNTNVIFNNDWMHISVSVDNIAKQVYIYKNGSLLSDTYNYATSYNDSQNRYFNYIGKIYNNAVYFNGQMTDLRFYNRALSVGEISEIYNNSIKNINISILIPNIDDYLFLHYNPSSNIGAGGTVPDLSGNNLDATLINNAYTTLNNSYNNNNTFQEIIFDGVDDYMLVPTLSTSYFNNGFTFCGWVYTDTGVVDYDKIFAFGNSATSQDLISLGVLNNPLRFRILISNSSGTTTVEKYTSSTYNVQQWYFISMSITKSNTYTYKLYVDGVLVLNETDTDSYIDIDREYNYICGGTGLYYHGKVSDLRWYSLVFTDEQVLNIYENTKNKFTYSISNNTNIFLQYNPSSSIGIGGTIQDLSGNNLDGTLVNYTHVYYDRYNKYVIKFDGTGDYITLPELSSTYFNNGFSFCGWVKYESFGSYDRIIDIANGGVTNGIVISNGNSTTALRVYYGDSGTSIFTDSNFFNSDIWIFFAVTSEPSTNTTKIYKNGILDTESSSSFSITDITRSTNSLGRSSTGDYFNGSMRDIRFYSTVLDYQEINNIYRETQVYNKPSIPYPLKYKSDNLLKDLFIWIKTDDLLSTGQIKNSILSDISIIDIGSSLKITRNQNGKPALWFENTNDSYIRLSTMNGGYLKNGFTWAGWVNSYSRDGSDAVWFFSTSTGNNDLLGVLTENSSYRQFIYNSGASSVAYNIPEVIEDNRWYHVVHTVSYNYDTQTYICNSYLNGKFSYNASYSNEFTNTYDFSSVDRDYCYIGKRPNNAYFFYGAMADLRWYSRVLSQDDITQLYETTYRDYQYPVNKSSLSANTQYTSIDTSRLELSPFSVNNQLSTSQLELQNFNAFHTNKLVLHYNTQDALTYPDSLIDYSGLAHQGQIFYNEVNYLQKLTASDGTTFDAYFGKSVAMYGDYIVIGSQSNDNGTNSGSAYVFKKGINNSFTELHKLTATDGTTYDYFSNDIAIYGDYIVIGAYYDDDKGLQSGSAYIFKNNGSDLFTQLQKLTAIDGASDDKFGNSVAIYDDYIIIGSKDNDDNGTDSGAVYIFKNNGSDSFTQLQKITASDGSAYDYFGKSVTMYGDYIVIGAHYDDNNTDLIFDIGSAYIFKKGINNSFTELHKLNANDSEISDFFGNSVAIYGDYIVIGSYNDDDNGTNSGSAYIFKNNGSDSFTQLHKLTAIDGDISDYFGISVAIYGDYIVIGSNSDDDKGSASGSAYIFKNNGSDSFTQLHKLTASDGASGDFFGNSVAIYGDYIVIGSLYDDDNAYNSGSAYVFKLKYINDIINNSFYFDGISDTYISSNCYTTTSNLAMPFNGITHNNSRTYSGWVYLNSLSSNNPLISWGADNGKKGIFDVYIDTDGRLSVSLDNDEEFIIKFEKQFIINDWHYISLVVDTSVFNYFNIEDCFKAYSGNTTISTFVENPLYSVIDSLDNDSNLFIHLPMDNIYGPISTNYYTRNLVDNGLTAQIVNMTASLNEEYLTGRKTLDFDGTNDYLQLPTLPYSYFENGFTFSGWVNINSNANDYDRIFTFSNSTINKEGIVFGILMGPLRFRVVIVNSSGSNTFEGITSSYSLNTWYHVCLSITHNKPITSTPNTYKIYVNGIEVLNNTDTSGQTTYNDVDRTNNYIGIRGDLSYDIDAQMYDLRWYSRILSANEISRLYTKSKHMFSTDTSTNNLLIGRGITSSLNASAYFNGYMDDIRLYARALDITELEYIWNNGNGSYSRGSNMDNTFLIKKIIGNHMILNARKLNYITHETLFDNDSKLVLQNSNMWLWNDLYDYNNLYNYINDIHYLTGINTTDDNNYPRIDKNYKLNKNLRFDDTNTYININEDLPASLFNNGFSVSVWLKPNNDYSGYIYHFGTDNSSNNNAIYLRNLGGTISSTIYNSSTQIIEATYTFPTTYIWYFVNIVVDINNNDYNSKIYINGKLEANEYVYSGTSMYSGDRDVKHIGVRPGAGSNTYYAGYMSDMRFYSRVLTDNDVWNLYQDRASNGFDLHSTVMSDQYTLSITDTTHTISQASNKLKSILDLDYVSSSTSSNTNVFSMFNWINPKSHQSGTLLASSRGNDLKQQDDFRIGLDPIYYDNLELYLTGKDITLSGTSINTIYDSSKNEISLSHSNINVVDSNYAYDVLDFNGTYSYINILQLDNTVFNQASGFTIATWIRLDISCTSNTEGIFNFTTTSSTTTDRIFLGPNNADDLQFTLGSTDYILTNIINDEVNNWIHIAIVVNSNLDVFAYKNGELYSSNTSIFTDELTNVNRNLCDIGAGIDADEFIFNGKMYDFRVYSKALTQKDIARVYNKDLQMNLIKYDNSILSNTFVKLLTNISKDDISTTVYSDSQIEYISTPYFQDNVYNFNGVNTKLELTSMPITVFRQGFSVLGWVNMDILTSNTHILELSNSGTSDFVIIKNGYYSSSNPNITVDTRNNLIVELQGLTSGDIVGRVEVPEYFYPGEWVNLGMVYDINNDELRVYKNSILTGSVYLYGGRLNQNLNSNWMGYNSINDVYMNGSLYDFTIYNYIVNTNTINEYFTNNSNLVLNDFYSSLCKKFFYNDINPISTINSNVALSYTSNSGVTSNLGYSNKIMTFNGIDSKLQLEPMNTKYFANDGMTFTFWANLNDLSSDYPLLGLYSNANTHVISLGTSTTGNLSVKVGNDVSSGLVYNGNVTSYFSAADTWQFCAISMDYNTSNIYPYVNGVLVSTNNYTPQLSNILVNTERFINNYIGYDYEANEYFKGKLTDFRMYDTPLTREHILDMYHRIPEMEFMTYNKYLMPEDMFLRVFTNNSSSEIIDSSYNNMTITNVNTVGLIAENSLYNQLYATKVMDFNGTNEYLQLPTLPGNYFANGFSFTGWVNFNNTSRSWERVFDFANGSANNNILIAHDGTTTTFAFNIFNGSTGQSVITQSNYFVNNEWVFISISSMSGNNKLYKNGELILSNTTTYTIQNVDRTSNYIGNSNWSYDADTLGQMFDLRFYSRILTANEISGIYNNDKHLFINENKLENQKFLSIELDNNDTIVNTSNNELTVTNVNSVSVINDLNELGRKVMNFNGTNEYLQLSTLPASYFNNGFSFTGWVNSTTSTTYPVIFDFAETNSGSDDNIVLFRNNGTNNLRYIIKNNSSGLFDISVSNYFISNEYSFISLTSESGNIKFYKNGTLVYTNTSNYTIPNVERNYNYIGRNAGGNYFTGQMYDLRWYSSILTEEQIKNIYETTRVKFDEFLRIGYTTDSSGTNTITDISKSEFAINNVNTVDLITNISDKYIKFDGTDDSLSVSNINISNFNNSFSMTIWIYRDSNDSLEQSCIFFSNYGASNIFRLYLKDSDDIDSNAIKFQVNNNSSTSYIAHTENNFYENNNWIHLTLIYDGSQSVGSRIRIYKNATLFPLAYDEGFNLDSIVDTQSQLYIFTTSTSINNSAFNGRLYDMRWYSKVLTQTEINKIYNKLSDYETSISNLFLTVSIDSNNDIINLAETSYTLTKNNQVSIVDMSYNFNYKVMNFNGTNEYLQLSLLPASYFNNGFSFTGWVKFETKDTYYRRIFNFGNSSNYYSIICWIHSTSGFGVEMFTTPNNEGRITLNHTTSSTYTATNTWYFISWIVDINNETSTLYINNNLIGTTNFLISYISVDRDTNFIGSQDSTNYFNGQMYDLRFYSRVLSANEIQAIYNQTKYDVENVFTNKLPSTMYDDQYYLKNANNNYISFNHNNRSSTYDDLFIWVNTDINTSSIVNLGYNNLSITNVNTVNIVTNDGVNDLDKPVMDFNGTNEYLQLPTLPGNYFANGFSFTGWVKLNNISGSVSERVFDFGLGQANNNILLFHPSTTLTLDLSVFNNSTETFIFHQANYFVNNSWIFISFSTVSGNNKLYKNGELILSNTTTYTIPNIDRTSNYIGKPNWNDGTAYTDGQMYDLRWYSRILTENEIQDIYNQSNIQNLSGYTNTLPTQQISKYSSSVDYISSSSNIYLSNVFVKPQEWNHIGLNYSATENTIEFYQNAEIKTTHTISNLSNINISNVIIGTNQDNGVNKNVLNADISDIIIKPRQITYADTIRDYYNMKHKLLLDLKIRENPHKAEHYTELDYFLYDNANYYKFNHNHINGVQTFHTIETTASPGNTLLSIDKTDEDYGDVISFDGSSQYIKIVGPVSTEPLYNYNVAFWVNLKASKTNNSDFKVVSKWLDKNYFLITFNYYTSELKVYFEDSLDASYNFSAYVEKGLWQHISINFHNRVGVFLYVNGEYIAQESQDIKFKDDKIVDTSDSNKIKYTTSNVYIGYNDATAFEGKIKGLQIYDGILNDVAIKEVYNSSRYIQTDTYKSKTQSITDTNATSSYNLDSLSNCVLWLNTDTLSATKHYDINNSNVFTVSSITDNSNNLHDITLYSNANIYVSSGVNSTVLSSIFIDNSDPTSNAYLSVPYPVTNNQDTFSMACWFNVASTSPDYQYIMFNGNETSNGYGLFMNNSNLKMQLQYPNENITISSDIQSDTWYHVAVTRNTSNNYIYLNGEYITNNGSSVYEPLSEFTIGTIKTTDGLSNSSSSFTGNIADVRVYDKVLSNTEISLLSKTELSNTIHYVNEYVLDIPNKTKYKTKFITSKYTFDSAGNHDGVLPVISRDNMLVHYDMNKFNLSSNIILDINNEHKSVYVYRHPSFIGKRVAYTHYNATMSNITISSSGYVNSNNIIFNGTNSWITVENGANLDTNSGNQWTINYWIKPDLDNFNSDIGTIWCKSNAGSFTSGAIRQYIDVSDNNILKLEISDEAVYNTNEIIEDNEWQMITTTFGYEDYASNILSIYVNGSKVFNYQNNDILIPSPSVNDVIRFGIDNLGSSLSNLYSGSMDNIQIWNNRLLEGEIQRLYNKKNTIGPVHYWNSDNIIYEDTSNNIVILADNGFCNSKLSIFGNTTINVENGKINTNYINLNGSNSYLTGSYLYSTEINTVLDNPRTHTLWFKIEENIEDEIMLFSYGQNNMFRCYIDNNYSIRIKCGIATLYSANNIVTNNEWYNLALTIYNNSFYNTNGIGNTNNIRLFLNSRYITLTSSATDIINTKLDFSTYDLGLYFGRVNTYVNTFYIILYITGMRIIGNEDNIQLQNIYFYNDKFLNITPLDAYNITTSSHNNTQGINLMDYDEGTKYYESSSYLPFIVYCKFVNNELPKYYQFQIGNDTTTYKDRNLNDWKIFYTTQDPIIWANKTEFESAVNESNIYLTEIDQISYPRDESGVGTLSTVSYDIVPGENEYWDLTYPDTIATSNSYNFSLDDIRIYNCTLSLDEIQNIYTNSHNYRILQLE